MQIFPNKKYLYDIFFPNEWCHVCADQFYGS